MRPASIPSFWRQIGGLDLGGSGEEGHPTAAVKMAHDPEADIVYITTTYRKKGGPIYEHAAALREWGADLPWAWPTDALQHERNTDLVVAIHVNREMQLNFAEVLVPKLALAAVWLYGAISPDQSKWMLYGDLLDQPAYYEIPYPS